MSRTRVLILSLALGALSITGNALAAEGECATDADCGQGLVCQVTGGTACACASDAPCPPCETVEYRECVPGPCAADADCGEGLVCVSWEEGCGDIAVPMPACPPDSSCEAAPLPEPCEPVTRSACAPKWAAPCETATDCGDGFACVDVESCSCSGGGSTDGGEPTEPTPTPDMPGASGAEAPGGSDPAPGDSGAPRIPEDERPVDDTCTCEPTGEKMCEPQEVACDADADCPTGWSCEKSDAPVATCAEAPGEPSNCAEAPVPPAETPGMCYPPGFDMYVGLGGSGAFGESHTSDDGGNPPLTPGTPTAGQNEAVGNGGTGPNCAGGQTPALPLLAVLGLLLTAVLRRREAVRA
jgi:hypothetical protein